MAFARVVELLARGRAGETAGVRGWLRTARHSKGVSFLDVSDGSCLAGLQVVAGPELANYDVRGHAARHRLRGRGRGRAGRVAGQGPGARAARHAAACRRPADPDYPLQKKRHGFEFLRTIAHLRPRTNTLGAVLRVRNVAARAVHRFFQERGFVWLHTPIITASDAEGAGAMFRVTATRVRRRVLRPAHVPDRVGPARGRDRRARALERLHVRADLPRRELEHQPPPRRVLDDRARDGVLRSAPGTWSSRRRSCAPW